jgi:uncharacterized protein YozE (UPF0346 family)
MRTKSPETFSKEFYNKFNKGEYTLMKPYVNSRTKLTVKCNACDNIWNPSSFNIMNDHSDCPKCSRKKVGHQLKRTQKDFENEVFDKVGDDYTVIGKYIAHNTKIKMRHNKCGNEYEVTPGHFLIDGRRCPKCSLQERADKRRYSLDFVKEKVHDAVGDEYSVISDYKSIHSKIWFKHNKCGYKYQTTVNQFLNTGCRCPKCKESKGEKEIARILDDLGISYVREKRFDGCRDKKPLPFDFYLEDSNTCIEYDGIQHFQTTNFGYNPERSLELNQLHDSIKNKFCEDNNINLVRIKYDDYDNIESILNNELNLS